MYTYMIVFREPNHLNVKPNPNQDIYKWELVDNIEYDNYLEAKRIREEYQLAMPNFTVRLRYTRKE